MMRNLSVSLTLSLYLLSTQAFANEEMWPYQITHDPFEMPVMQINILPDKTVDKPVNELPARELKLFTTLRAGKNSMANISGRILKIGQIIDGYELIAVHERSVELLKNQQRTRLSLDDSLE